MVHTGRRLVLRVKTYEEYRGDQVGSQAELRAALVWLILGRTRTDGRGGAMVRTNLSTENSRVRRDTVALAEVPPMGCKSNR